LIYNKFIINNNDSGQRLDKYLSKALPSLPFSMMYKAIRTKDIKVNKKRTAQDYRLCEGDVVEVYLKEDFSKKDEYAFKKLTPNLNIVYEDENILLANKPQGVSVHPDAVQKSATLIDHIKAYLFQKGEYVPEEEASFAPSLCNRIDRNTIGMVICAKNAASLRQINEMIKENRVCKKYKLLCHGTFRKKSGQLTNYLEKNRDENMVKILPSPTPSTVTAITKYRVLRENTALDISLCEAELLTGRTHQIRAQFAHISHPLVGDGKYGINRDDVKMGFKYQALCSYSLEFMPEKDTMLSYLSGKVFTIETPFDDFI